ncbi:MAG: 23S rRNA pseudouridine(1911/1915/1917) synthase RluD [Gammaproteobacteria bacterium]|nr:MAG: 23S rRNA pseudouridine(1911/1915/1917) synthase RluD [Gammaproteobacteria bacterium]
MHGLRLDQALSKLFPEYSRARIQKWIRQNQVLVNGQSCKPKMNMQGGERILLDVQPEPETHCEAQDIPLNIVFADDQLIVVDKPAGMVVHPAAGNPDGTLQNALLFHFPEQELIPRAGIVHRLDKDTSGLMVMAHTLEAHKSLVAQLQSRQMGREYEAIVNGVLIAGGTVNEPIGRHPVDRKKMAIVRNGKPAVTHYRVIDRFDAHTHIRVKLETGRTHQIRVHMAHIRHPIIGDPVYGGRQRVPVGASEKLISTLQSFPRQALHAVKLELMHPANGESMHWVSTLPADMNELLELLNE